MDTTTGLAERLRVTPFEIMAQDADEVILLINYYIEKSEGRQERRKQKADDGFWDF